jgi:hypothetical protein
MRTAGREGRESNAKDAKGTMKVSMVVKRHAARDVRLVVHEGNLQAVLSRPLRILRVLRGRLPAPAFRPQ